jgi:hypothetical protein
MPENILDIEKIQREYEMKLTSHQIKQNPAYFSKDGKWCYQISIIDYLQTFDFGKKQEVMAKKLFKRADP